MPLVSPVPVVAHGRASPSVASADAPWVASAAAQRGASERATQAGGGRGGGGGVGTALLRTPGNFGGGASPANLASRGL